MGLHKVSRRVEVAWKGHGSGSKSENSFFEVGAKYLVDPNTVIKASISVHYSPFGMKIVTNPNSTLRARSIMMGKCLLVYRLM